MTNLKRVYEKEFGKRVSTRAWQGVTERMGKYSLPQSIRNVRFMAKLAKLRIPCRVQALYFELEQAVSIVSAEVNSEHLLRLVTHKLGVTPSRSTIYRWLGTSSKEPVQLSEEEVRVVLIKALNLYVSNHSNHRRQP
jgi:hypothetical protein